jgi:uncharacterized protein involved in exopolysaccharide biosynthesis
MSQMSEWTRVDGEHMPGAPYDGGINVRQLLLVLWKRKYTIAAISIGCGLVAFASSYLFKQRYEAAVVFATVTDDAADRAGGLGALASQFGGLAALGGISLSTNERKAEYLAMLQSQRLFERFISENNLMPILNIDAWDEARGDWKVADPDKRPSMWTTIQFFKSKVVRVKTDKTGITTLSISWSDADAAARWANGLVEMANERVRANTIEEAERNVAYLNGQLAKTSVVAVQGSISTLLENQIKRIMLAQGTDQYAFRVIDPALPPERASSPKRILLGILGSISGLIVSVAFVIAGNAVSHWKGFFAQGQ